MKVFLIKLGVLILVFLSGGILELILPIDFFTKRTWEAISFQKFNPVLGRMYPNINRVFHEKGDLSKGIESPDVFVNRWIIDKFGFRNDSIIRNPDVIIIGDSFIAGALLDQDSILSNVISKKTNSNLMIYNLAPASFQELDILIKNRLIKKPKFIIFEYVQRSFFTFELSKARSVIPLEVYYEYGLINFFSSIDRMMRFYFFSKLFNQIKSLTSFPEVNGSYFISGSSFLLKNEFEVHRDIEELSKMKEYASSKDIDLLVLPIPDKEIVCNDFFSDKNFKIEFNDYVKRLCDSGLHVIDVSNFLFSPCERVFYKQDTHWSPLGVEIVADAIIDKINAN